MPYWILRPRLYPRGCDIESARELDNYLSKTQPWLAFRTEPSAPGVPRTVGKKTGRNEPCPCGSGRKFKQCCGRTSSSTSAVEDRPHPADEPVEQLSGLSTRGLYELEESAFAPNSPLGFRDDVPDELLDQSAFFTLFEELVRFAARNDGIPRTQTGAMAPSCVGEFTRHPVIAAESQGLPEPRREAHSRILGAVRMTAEASPLFVRHQSERKMVLSTHGQSLHESNDRSAMFRILLWSFFERYLLFSLDSFVPFMLEDDLGFLLYVVTKFGGDGITTAFLINSVVKATPGILDAIREESGDQPIPVMTTQIEERLFRHGLHWFGLVDDSDGRKRDMSGMAIRTTPLFDAAIQIRGRRDAGLMTVH